MATHRTIPELRLTLTAAPSVEPLPVSEAKTHLRVDTTADDTLIASLVTAARRQCESYTGRALITQTWTLYLDDWPARTGVKGEWWDGIREGPVTPGGVRAVGLPKPPLQSVVLVNTYDDADAATLWAAGNYFVDTASEPGRLVARDAATFPVPTRAANGIEIRFTAGYGAIAGDVPEVLREGNKRFVAHMYEHRGDDARTAVAASGAAALWGPLRVLALI